MNWPRAIIHIDMDTFFVSVERKNDPALVGRPVIVGGGPGGEMRRGVVAACSYETRRFGVHSAMPLAEAMRRCPDAVIVPVGRSRYSTWTRRVRGVLEGFTDLFEMTSPDEAYVSLEGTERLYGPPIEAAHELRRRIADEVGLPVSVGVAASRTVAKIASKLAKPQGLYAIFPGGEEAVLRHLPLRGLPGLGPKTEQRLRRIGIHDLRDLIDAGEKKLTDRLGDHGADLLRRAIGRGSARVQKKRDPISISSEETFAEDVGDESRLDAEMGRMAMKIGSRLRRLSQHAGTMTIKLRYPDFTTLTRQMPLVPATNDDRAILDAGRHLLRLAWDRRRPLRLIGIGVANLTDLVQEDLFESAGAEKRERLLATLDRVHRSKGQDKLVWGSTLREEPSARKPT